MKKIIGIDIGGTFIKYGVVQENGRIDAYQTVPTKRENSNTILQNLRGIICKLQEDTGIYEVGVSLPGIISSKGEMISAGALEELKGMNIIQELESYGEVRVINDANAVALSEKRFGAARGFQNFIIITVGTGIGGAIFLNDQLLLGNNGAAGEFGTALMFGGVNSPLYYESVSLNCGAVAGLCRSYSCKKGIDKVDNWETDVKKILRFAHEGDIDAVESLEEFYHFLAVLILNLSVTLDPQIVLIGGGISENPEILSKINNRLERLSTNYPEKSLQKIRSVDRCQLGNFAGVLGAGCLFF